MNASTSARLAGVSDRMPRFSFRSAVLVMLTLFAATRAPADVDALTRRMARLVSTSERALRWDAPVHHRNASPVPPGWTGLPLGAAR